MKITDEGIIQTSEKELIDAITGDLDWGVIENVFRSKYGLGLQDNVEYKRGDMIIHQEQIAYKLDFEVKVNISVLFDRKGECLDVIAVDETASSELDGDDPDKPLSVGGAGDEDQVPGIGDSAGTNNENVNQMASQIADMISDINED